MNNAIRTYDDLLAHQQQLKELLAAQKQLIRYDVEELKAELKPLTMITRVAAKFFTRNKDQSLFVNTAGSLIDLVVKKVLMRRAGWISRLVIPFFAKNISSHLIAGTQDGLLDRISSLLSHKKSKKI